jgi:hypothetical protein
MAVPKKRRVVRKLLNRGARFKCLYQTIVSSGAARLRAYGLGKALLVREVRFVGNKLPGLVSKPSLVQGPTPFERPPFNLSKFITPKRLPIVIRPLRPSWVNTNLGHSRAVPYNLTAFKNYVVTWPWNTPYY